MEAGEGSNGALDGLQCIVCCSALHVQIILRGSDNLRAVQNLPGQLFGAATRGLKCTFAQFVGVRKGRKCTFALGGSGWGVAGLELFRGDGLEEGHHFGWHVHRAVVEQPLHLQSVHDRYKLPRSSFRRHAGPELVHAPHFGERFRE